jgi:hypothetical protein
MRHALTILVTLVCGAGLGWAGWGDTFDCYPADTPLTGQGGWELWYSGGNDGFVSTDFAASAPNSMEAVSGTDMVQLFSIDSGKWTLRCKLYVPSSATGDGYVIMMNQYGAPAIDNWSLQVRFDSLNGIVESQFDYNTLPLIMDEWVELRAEIDLDSDVLDIYYGADPLALGLIWTENVSGGGITSIACLDLYSQSLDGIYYDDVSLLPPALCGDANCDGVIDNFDIDPFVLALTDPCTYMALYGCLMNCDTNLDGTVDNFDIDTFVFAVTNGHCL